VEQFMDQQVTPLATVQTKAEMIDRVNKAQDEAYRL
jgi:hypothetical protein